MKVLCLLFFLTSIAVPTTVYCGSMQFGTTVPFSGSFFDQMHFQTLLLANQLGINGSITQIAFRTEADGPMGIFHNGRVTLCHTDLTSLGLNFADNYDGYSPVDTLAGAEIVMPSLANAWVVMDFTLPFPYNASHNLIVEIRWDGDNGEDVPVWAWDPASGNHRVWYPNLASPDGYPPERSAYYMRLIVSGISVEPYSLGKIKATFN